LHARRTTISNSVTSKRTASLSLLRAVPSPLRPWGAACPFCSDIKSVFRSSDSEFAPRRSGGGGQGYEYLIGQFAAGSGKKAGEFYTPQQISSILSAIVTLDSQAPETGPRKKLESVFDFACGSGSLLLNVRHRIKDAGGTIGKIYGQEYNVTTYNLARMNMLLHGVKDTEFEIYHGDTLTNAWDFLRETNPAKKPQFDAVVANPPFSYRWEPTDAISEDMRFKSHGVAPKSAADFAFLLHGLHYVKDDGVMAVILPHGVLFRGGAEERTPTPCPRCRSSAARASRSWR
jgi:type I restriction enzyme M protein